MLKLQAVVLVTKNGIVEFNVPLVTALKDNG